MSAAFEEIRALDQRLLETEVENLDALAVMLGDRARKIDEMQQTDRELSHWLEIESNGSEMECRLEELRRVLSQNLAAAEQELRRLEAFQSQQQPEEELAANDGRLIDRLG